MADIYGKGDRGKATRLHSELIRAINGQCERCGAKANLQCAHIVSRSFAHTRTDLDNAFCLCAGCHMYFNKWPIEFGIFVFDTITRQRYEMLRDKAIAGVGKKFNWKDEVVRLQAVKEAM